MRAFLPRLLTLTAIALIAAFSTGCTFVETVELVPRDVTAEIKAANEEFMKHANAKDAAGVAELYTDDARLYPPDIDPVIGRDSIGDFWEAAFGNPALSAVRLDTTEAEASGEVAWETGIYTMTAADGSTLATGSYLVVWHRRDGRWKLHRDIWN